MIANQSKGLMYGDNNPFETVEVEAKYCPAAMRIKLKIKTMTRFMLKRLLMSFTIFFGEYPKLFLMETSSCFSKN